MTLCRQKVTKQVKMCGFSTTIIENSAFAIFTCYENFSSSKSYHKATAPISTVLFALCPMPWRNVMGLIKNWDNQNQQAKSFQMRYNLSKLNYQTLSSPIRESASDGWNFSAEGFIDCSISSTTPAIITLDSWNIYHQGCILCKISPKNLVFYRNLAKIVMSLDIKVAKTHWSKIETIFYSIIKANRKFSKEIVSNLSYLSFIQEGTLAKFSAFSSGHIWPSIPRAFIYMYISHQAYLSIKKKYIAATVHIYALTTI